MVRIRVRVRFWPSVLSRARLRVRPGGHGDGDVCFLAYSLPSPSSNPSIANLYHIGANSAILHRDDAVLVLGVGRWHLRAASVDTSVSVVTRRKGDEQRRPPMEDVWLARRPSYLCSLHVRRLERHIRCQCLH